MSDDEAGGGSLRKSKCAGHGRTYRGYKSGKPAGHQCLWSRKSEKRTSDLHCRCKTGHGYFSKWIGIEGTSIIAKEKEEELKTHFAVPFIENAKALDAYISVQSEAAVAVTSGVSAMHDVTEGGIFGALWEMAEASGVGLEIDLKKIPIRQETVEVCEFFGVNPYLLISSGCMLMAAQDGNHLVRELEKAGIKATIIGKATAGNDRVLLNEDERRFLEPPKTDELYKVIGR